MCPLCPAGQAHYAETYKLKVISGEADYSRQMALADFGVLKQNEADGNYDDIRLLNGEPLTLTLVFFSGPANVGLDLTAELVKEYWEDVGIGIQLNQMERAAIDEAQDAGLVDVYGEVTHGAGRSAAAAAADAVRHGAHREPVDGVRQRRIPRSAHPRVRNAIVSGEALVAIVLSLPTIGPLLLHGLSNQDMYLASGIILILGALTMVGTLVSDLFLMAIDPRIRFEARA